MKDNSSPLMAPKIDPLAVDVGRIVRARHFKKSARVERVTEDRLKVQLKDDRKLFWISMSNLVADWA